MTFNAGAWKLYIDGEEVASTTSAVTSIFSAGNSDLCLGSYPTYSNRFVGLIDEPMVFNRALSPMEIQALYEVGGSGLCGLGTVVAVDDPVPSSSPPSLGLQLLAPRPHPARASVELGFRLAEESRVTLEVFDVAGRRVARLAGGEPLPSGDHRLFWNGVGYGGRPVASGVYLVRLTDGHRTATQRVVWMTR
jgi:hypothetical protein